jgi:hypothetical protein
MRLWLFRVFQRLSSQLVVPWMKVAVVASTLGLLAFGTYGLINLRMEFRPEWLMDPKSESKATITLFLLSYWRPFYDGVPVL